MDTFGCRGKCVLIQKNNRDTTQMLVAKARHTAIHFHHTMESSEFNEARRGLLLHDTGRLHLALRLPIAIAGIFLLWLSAHELSSHLFHFDLGLHFTDISGSPWVAIPSTLGLGLLFFSVWFLRNQIFWDADHKDVLLRHSGLLGNSTRRISMLNATGIYVHHGRAIGNRFWDIGIAYKDGREQ